MAAKKKSAVEKAPAKPSLDIKDEMLYADYKGFGWIDDLPVELAKTFSPLIAMKWFSVLQMPNGYDTIPYKRPTSEDEEHYIVMINELLNLNFWDLSKYPDLQWRIMCSIGLGKPLKHGWIPLANKKKTVSKVNAVFLKLHPQLNDEELALLRSKYDVDSFKQLLRDLTIDEKEAKDLVAEFKKTNG